MHRGFVKDWRKAVDSSLYWDVQVWHLFMHIVKGAAWKSANGIARGEYRLSYKVLAECYGVDKSTVCRWVQKLQREKMITCRQDATGRLVATVCNYTTYQDETRDDATQTQRECNGERNANATQYKKEKNIQESKNDDVAAAGSVLDSIRDFAIAWNTTKGCQKADEETIRRLAANGRASGFRDEGWLEAYPRALRKFPLRYFKTEVAVGQFLQGDFVWNVLAGMYQAPAGGPPAKADSPAGMVSVDDPMLWQECPENLRKGKPGKSDFYVNSAWLEARRAKTH